MPEQPKAMDSAAEVLKSRLRIAALAGAYLFSEPSSASAETEADKRLRSLAQLPPSCALLVEPGGKGSVADCRAAFDAQLSGLKSFVETKQERNLSILSSKTSQKERCAIALPIITKRKNEMIDIARFLGGEISDDGNDPVTQILSAKSVQELKDKLGRKPGPDDFAALAGEKLDEAREKAASCGLLIRAAMALVMGEGGKVHTEIELRAPELIKLIQDGIADRSDTARLRRAVVAMVSFLMILEEVAQAGAR